jgi:siderophore synthetase component
MKTIQIPMNSNPFTVVINNNVYRYTAGDTVEVPDEVAEAIEDALELAPKPKRYLSKIAQIAEGSITELTTSDLGGIEKICAYAFYTCRGVVKATIPNCVKGIEDHAFYGCGRLESLVIGNSVASIGNNAFDWCTKLASVYLPETPPALANINAFDNINAGCVFYCRTQESLEAYKAAENWSALAGTYTFVVEA